MNRADFMDQLESLLQSIAPTEREEAIQYYNDYFDDAGPENEGEVIEALGNPARVAENIKRDLLGNGYGEKPVRKAQASDRALMEYGKDDQEGDGEPAQERQEGDAAGSPGGGSAFGQGSTNGGQGGAGGGPGFGQGGASGGQGGQGGASGGQGGQGGSIFGQGFASTASGSGQGDRNAASGFGQSSGNGGAETAQQAWGSFEGYGRSTQDYAAGDDQYRWSHDTAGWFGNGEDSKRRKLPAWGIALLVTVLIFASPVLAGIVLSGIGLAIGILASWFGMILGLGVASLCLLAVFIVLVITGIICSVTSPWVGMAMVGGGLICGCVGILFLMLTVAMAGIVTPAACRGIGRIFCLFKGKRRKAAGI